jgi:hypothetical protein
VLSKSSRLTNRIQLIINKDEMKVMKQREFEDLVHWVTNIDAKISETMKSKKGGEANGFQSVNYKSIMTALLGMMDAKVLTKDL